MFADYQPPTLYAPRKGTWRISFYCRHPETGNLQRVQKTFGLNRIRCKKERRKVAATIMNQVYLALTFGYNYFIDTAGIDDTGCRDHTPGIGKMVTDLLQPKITGKKKRTRQTYTSYNNVFTQWLQDEGIHGMPSTAFTTAHFESFIDYKLTEGCGNRKINDYIGYFKAIFKMAVRRGHIKTNPAEPVDYLPDVESTLFEPLTAQELAIIGPHLKEYKPRYYIYTKFTALEWIRPYHIAFLKASDIDYANDTVNITAITSKNNKVKKKQLLPELKQLLIEHGYHQLPGHWYLFGKNFEPSPTLYESLSIRSAELWKEIVIDGLNINKKMYCLKHTAGTYYVNENKVDAEWLQGHMEHYSLSQTEVYIKTKKTKKLDTKDAKLIEY